MRASSLNDNDMSKLYPNLSHALGDDDGFFDPTDPLVDKSMRGLLKELNHLLSTKYELNLRGISNQHISYVRWPRRTSDHTFTNSKEWLNIAIKISGSKMGGTFESAYRIANHLIKYYKDSFLAAYETQRVPVIKPMTATEFQAMLYAGGDKMEDWVERLHQTGMRMRQRFHTVRNPLVWALAREKADSCNAHPDVIAYLEGTNKRNKRKYVSEKRVDVIGTRQKRQRDMGRFDAMQYFEGNKNKKLMWSAL